jgi:hypothetical protein
MSEMRPHLIAAVAALAVWLAAPPLFAQDQTAPAADRTGHVAAGVGFGPMFGTEGGTLLGVALHGDYFMNNEVSVGPLLQLGFADNDSLIGASVQLKYTVDISGNPPLHPHVQVGIGFVHVSDGASDTDFLLPLGGGLDVDVAKNLSLGTTLLINVTGLDDDIFLTWLFGFKVLI